MKLTFKPTTMGNGVRRVGLGLVVASTLFLQYQAKAASITYGDAFGFAVLAGTAITDAGNFSTINGNAGVYPGTSDGLLPSQVNGTIYARSGDDVFLLSAKNAFDTAKIAAAGLTPGSLLGAQLGGQTLVPGVYSLADVALLTGTLTLDGTGYTDPFWVFQGNTGTGSLVTSAGAPGSPGSKIALVNATACDVLWEIPTQVTLGTYSEFVGTIMAGTAIVMNNGATLDGRAWADAEITLDNNTITGLACTSLGGDGGGSAVPDAGSTLLLALIGLGGVVFLRNRWDARRVCS